MPGLMRGIARTAVVAGTATAVSGRVSRRQQGRWAAKEQSEAPPAEAAPAAAAPAAAPPAAQGGDMDNKLAQLKQLGELKQAGVLTDAEFEVQKDKILHG
jgi:hypothetical protein